LARIRKLPTDDGDTGPGQDPQNGDDLRRFIEYAGDMIAAQEAVRADLAGVRLALEKAVLGYDRTALAIAKRERDGIAVRFETDIDGAIRRVRAALTNPVMRAETIAREVRLTAALAGLAGGFVGAGGVVALLMFRII
jgi:hypothetical protein